MHMRKEIIIAVLIVVLTAGLTLSATAYYKAQNDLTEARLELTKQKNNERMKVFLGMFVEKVIKAEKAVSFEERLRLENTVRQLNDTQILAAWKKFVDSKTETEAQKNVKELLGLLVSKM